MPEMKCRWMKVLQRGATLPGLPIDTWWQVFGYKDCRLGTVDYNSQWKLYELSPCSANIALTAECLAALAEFCKEATEERKAAKP